MAQVTVKINGYVYNVGCENGQEQHLQQMAQQVETRIDGLKNLRGGPTGEGRLLVLAALLMADELHDLHIELTSLRKLSGPTASPAETERADTKRLNRIARKAEEIAASLDQP